MAHRLIRILIICLVIVASVDIAIVTTIYLLLPTLIFGSHEIFGSRGAIILSGAGVGVLLAYPIWLCTRDLRVRTLGLLAMAVVVFCLVFSYQLHAAVNCILEEPENCAD